jgi:uncharacterized protein
LTHFAKTFLKLLSSAALRREKHSDFIRVNSLAIHRSLCPFVVARVSPLCVEATAVIRKRAGKPGGGWHTPAVKSSAWRPTLIRYIRAHALPPDKFSHQPRLYQLAVRLAGNRAFDDDVLFAAAWLHDLGVFIGHRPKDLKQLAAWDHVAYVVRKAPALLRRVGFPARKIPAALEVIRTHLPDTQPTTFEGTLMRDADILEQLGAVGILRTVSKVGRDTRFVRFSDALRVLQRNADELPGKLQLARAKRLAGRRVRLLRAFLRAASSEAGKVQFLE